MKKKLTAFILPILVFILACMPVMASESTYDYNGYVRTKFEDNARPYHVLVKSSNGNVEMLATNQPVKYRYVGMTDNVVLPSGVAWGLYRYNNNIWTKYAGEDASASEVTWGNVIIWSNYDVYNYDTGELYVEADSNFFPLAVRVQKMTEKTLTETTVPQMGGAVKVLVVCGVGLLALLILLPLFGKRSLLYLKR